MNDKLTKPLAGYVKPLTGCRTAQARANYIKTAVLCGIKLGLTPKEILDEIGENKTTLNHVKNIYDMIKASDM